MVKKAKTGKTTKTTKKVVKTTSKAAATQNMAATTSKTKKTKKTKKSTKKSLATKETTPPTPPTATTTTTTKKTTDDVFATTIARIEENYDSLITEVDELVKANKALSARLKKGRKMALKDVNALYKKARGDIKKRKQRKPSGFAKPSLISDELCEFLGKPKGTEMARTHVTSFITDYIKNNNLQNPKNKKEIILDDKLSKLITVGDNDDTLTYFNIQKYMKHHYKSSSSSATVSV